MRRTRPAPTLSEALEPRRLFAVELISAAAGGTSTGDGPSPAVADAIVVLPPASPVSDDGRYVAFSSNAHNLVAGITTSGSSDVFVRDRVTGTTRLASVRSDGQPAGDSSEAGISGDGRYVVFTSSAAGVVPGDALYADVFVRDTVGNTTTLASHTPAGLPGQGDSFLPSISRNGRYVAFLSNAPDLVAGMPLRDGGNLYRFDVQTGAVQAVTDAATPAGFVGLPKISDDGNVLCFDLSSDVETFTYVRDMAAGALTLASVGADGAPVDGGSDYVSELAGGGRHVLFGTTTRATPNDLNDTADVFVRDLAAGTTTLVSVDANGESAHPDAADGSNPSDLGYSISTDGRFVVFESGDDLTGVADRGGGENNFSDVFLRDLVENATRLLSVDPPGEDPEESFLPTISADGRFAAMMSDRPAPWAGPTQLVVINLATGEETVANRTAAGGVLDLGFGVAAGAVFSRNGGAALFSGEFDAAPLFPGVADANAGSDLFALAIAGLGLDTRPPSAVVSPPATLAAAAPFVDFDVAWSDDFLVDAATLGDGDVVVSGPGAFLQPATLLGITPAADAQQIVARYRLQSPGGVFDAAYNGAYVISAGAGQVVDVVGNAHPDVPLPAGLFSIAVPPTADGPDLQTATLQGAVPASVVGGEKQKVKPLQLGVTNAGNQPAAGAVTVRLLASADAVPDAADAVVAELPGQKVRLAPGKTKVFKLKVGTFPAVPDGDYRLIAVFDAGGALAERLESNNVAVLASPVRIAAPFSDLGVSDPVLTGRLAPGKKASLAVTLRNDGNQPAAGTIPLRVRLTADPANPAAASREVQVSLKFNLKPGASRLVRAKLTLPTDLPAGNYFVVVELLTPDADAADNTAAGASPVTV